MKKFLLGTALIIAVASPSLTSAAIASTQMCTTTKVVVMETIHVKIQVKVKGKVITETVKKKVKAHVLKRERVKIHGKWTTKMVSVVKYKNVTSCTTPPTTTTLPAPTTTTSTSTTTTTTTIPGPAAIGTSFAVTDSYGDNVVVALQQVMNPATPATIYDAAPTGYQLIGTKFSVTNKAAANFTDDMNNDVTIIGSDLQTYTPTFNSISGCTNFNFGDVDLATNASSVGCVSFQLPNGVTPAQVDFSPSSGFSGVTARWVG